MLRDRVSRLVRVKASSIVPNSANPRLHPPEQLAALSGAIAEIGVAGAILAFERGDQLVAIDGHARLKLLGDAEVPVLVLDLDEDEANKLLISYDALSGMAHYDGDMLRSLADSVQFDSEAVNQMIQELVEDNTYKTPAQPEEFPEELPKQEDGTSHGLWFTDNQWLTIQAGIAKFRQAEGDETVSGSTAVEMLLADYISGA